MSCTKSTCMIGGDSYLFFRNNRQNYDGANNACERLGGTLAVIRQSRRWAALRKCCPAQETFWIGLRPCRMTNEFSWTDKARECVNISPFEIPTRDSMGCRAVSVKPGTVSIHPYPKAIIEACSTKLPFICQVKPAKNSTTETPVSLRRSDLETTFASENKFSSSSHLNVNLQPTTNFINANSTTPFSSKTGQSASAGAIIGGVLGAFIIILMLIALFLCYKRKWTLQKVRSIFVKAPLPSSTTDNIATAVPVRVDHGYYSVEIQHDVLVDSSENYGRNEISASMHNINAYANVMVSDDSTEANTADQTHRTVFGNRPRSQDATYSLPQSDRYLIAHPTSDQLSNINRFSSIEPLELEVETVGVEYATVRDINKPNDVYATVNKPGKTKN